jgi:molecular chaperone DnaK (HSP70)
MKIGIDFGSTYSMVSKYNSITNNVEAITFSEGEPVSIPSVVCLSKQGKITCGRGAKDQTGKKTVRIFDAFKMLLTETDTDMLTHRGYDGTYTPRVITKYFLESMLRGVMHREGCTEFEDVVICVPEIWGKNYSNLNAQDGRIINDGSRSLSPEELLHMDWLCENVDGSIPTFEEIAPFARDMVRELGVYRDSIPMEKEGSL